MKYLRWSRVEGIGGLGALPSGFGRQWRTRGGRFGEEEMIGIREEARGEDGGG